MGRKVFSVISPSAFRALIKTSTSKSRVVPIDSSWYMPNSPNNGFTEYKKSRINGSVFFDLDKVCDKASTYPHMLPDLQTFNKEISQLGINKTDTLVFYDKQGNFSSPRAAWTFSMFNHNNVYLLNHYPLYLKSEYSIDSTPTNIDTPFPPSNYESDTFYENDVVSFEKLETLVKTGDIKNYQLFDARSNDRFTGEAPEPRKGLSSGHVPTARSLPFNEVLNADKTFLPKEILVKKFKDMGVTNDKEIIVMCGTGVTAVILKVAFHIAGYKSVVYDGSWTEWAQRVEQTPEFISKGN